MLGADFPLLAKENLAHLRVLRLRDGELVELFDGAGSARVFRWSAAESRLAAEAPIRRIAAYKPFILFACVTKGSRWDWTIEKVTELGVTRIVPVISDRTIVRIAPDERLAKVERWRRIAIDAARQSDAMWVPEIVEPVSFAEALPLVKATTCFVGALTTPPPPPLLVARSQCAAADLQKPIATFIGPEGDFTPEELRQLLEIAIPTGFGNTILRAETAAIFAVSVLRAYDD